MSLFLRSNIIHMSVYDPVTITVYSPTKGGYSIDPGIPYIKSLWVCTENEIDLTKQYTVIKTIIEMLNPFRKQYNKDTNNCCTFVAELLDLPVRKKRPVDVYKQISDLPRVNA